jgi:hypothetical protein
MGDDSGLGTEARRIAVEIMSNVPWFKRILVDKILKPAGVPREIYARHLDKIDELSGRKVTKRAAAPEILAEMEARGEGARFVRAVIQIGASWTDFHLHEREMEARATVEKAKAFLIQLEGLEARERARQDELHREEKRQREREQADQFKRERNLLKMQFDALHQMSDAQERGRQLEDFLNRFFALFRIQSVRRFQRNEGGEQIDGVFRWEGWHYIVECKWQKTSLIFVNSIASPGKSGGVARERWECSCQ